MKNKSKNININIKTKNDKMSVKLSDKLYNSKKVKKSKINDDSDDFSNDDSDDNLDDELNSKTKDTIEIETIETNMETKSVSEIVDDLDKLISNSKQQSIPVNLKNNFNYQDHTFDVIDTILTQHENR